MPASGAARRWNCAGSAICKFRQDGKVFQHHDYFDMGEFIYERVPVLGGVIRAIKNRL